MTRSDRALPVSHARIELNRSEPGNATETHAVVDASVFRGLYWAAVAYALCGAGMFLAWRAIAN